MGGPGSGRRAPRAMRDAHNRRLDPADPADLEEISLTHHKQLANAAFALASRGHDVTATLAELAEFEDACRRENVHEWNGTAGALIRMAADAAAQRGE